MQSRKYIWGAFFIILCVAAVNAAAPTLTFTYHDVHANKTALETDTYGLNNKGTIVGDFVDSAGIQHGMILAGTKLTKADRSDCLNSPGSTTIAFYGINSAGVAAGWCTNTSSVLIGFTFSAGKFHNIHIKGATGVEAIGINDKGAIVGTYFDSAGVQHAYLLKGTTLTTLPTPSAITSTFTAWSINNNGVIAVFGINSAGGYSSFTTANNGKTYKAFKAPNAGPLGTAVHKINNKGDIVGTYFDSSNVSHGILLHGGKFFSFDDPNSPNTRGDGVNDTLVIVGRYGSGAFGGTGFEATAKQ